MILNFEPTEKPEWRAPDAPATSVMLKEIAEFRAAFERSPDRVKDMLSRRITRQEACNFVFASNQLDFVGTQTEGDTLELCKRAAESIPLNDQAKRETVQTARALQHSHRLLTAMKGDESDSTVLYLTLTPDLIREIHRTLMTDLIYNPGQYRAAQAIPGFAYMYAAPEFIENRMLVFTDSLSDCLWDIKKTEIPLDMCFKLSAYVLFNGLDIHPFSDGNGRLFRILASRMLSPYHFFPVYIHPEASKSWRDSYIACLVKCRSTDRQPRDLAALLIESSWIIWKRVYYDLCQMLDDTHTLPYIGTIYFTSFAFAPGSDLLGYVSERFNTLLLNLREVSQDDVDKAAIVEAASVHADTVRVGGNCVVRLVYGK